MVVKTTVPFPIGRLDELPRSIDFPGRVVDIADDEDRAEILERSSASRPARTSSETPEPTGRLELPTGGV